MRRVAWIRAAVVGVVLAAWTGAPALAADQRQLAVVAGQTGPWTLRIINPDGSLVRTIVSRPSSNLGYPSWSPDEQTLAYFENGKILLQPAAGGTEQPLTDGGQPAYSPIEDEIAYFSWTSPTRTLRVIGTDGTNDRPIAGPFSPEPSPPAWSADGSTLAFGINGGISTVPIAGGSPTPLVTPSAPGEIIARPAYSPDGTRLAYVRSFPVPPGATTRPDQLVIRFLATGDEDVIVEHPGGFVRFGNVASPSWSADSERIAFIEDDFTGGPDPIHRVVTVASDGSGRSVLLTENPFIHYVAWNNAPRLPSYFVRQVEVAQAIGPQLGAAPAVNPLEPGTTPFTRTLPSLNGFGMPLVEGKQTLVRIYVGDASLPAGQTARRTLPYRVSGPALPIPVEGQAPVDVTAPDVGLAQKSQTGAIAAWLPAADALYGPPTTLQVEVNPDETAAECEGCHPNGNRAELRGVQFVRSGALVVAVVEMRLITDSGSVVRPDPRFAGTWAPGLPLLPIADDALHVDTSTPPAYVRLADLRTNVGWLTGEYACDKLLAKLTIHQAMTAWQLHLPPGLPRWAGIATDPPASGLDVRCGGLGQTPGTSFITWHPVSKTFVHEFGHTVGLRHAVGYNVQGGNAVPLPYPGIGGIGYGPAPTVGAYDWLFTSDLMSYSTPWWTSPKTWQTMYDAMLTATPAPAPRAARAPQVRSRRLVTGIVGEKGDGVILESLVVPASAPEHAGPVIGRLVARDPRGKRVATVAVHGTAGAFHPPFIAELPASARVGSLELLPKAGGKPLDRMKASRHAPSGRFRRLPRKANPGKSLSVAWTARDRDRDPLTVVVQARRSGRRWTTLATATERGKASVVPRSLGAGKRLRLRLLIGDGLRTAVADARPIRL
jgi:WD40 repeat protein